jgi:hypothetical protein
MLRNGSFFASSIKKVLAVSALIKLKNAPNHDFWQCTALKTIDAIQSSKTVQPPAGAGLVRRASDTVSKDCIGQHRPFAWAIQPHRMRRAFMKVYSPHTVDGAPVRAMMQAGCNDG